MNDSIQSGHIKWRWAADFQGEWKQQLAEAIVSPKGNPQFYFEVCCNVNLHLRGLQAKCVSDKYKQIFSIGDPNMIQDSFAKKVTHHVEQGSNTLAV